MGASKEFTSHLWNTSSGRSMELDHLEMVLRVEPQEGYILNRLAREGKHGHVSSAGENLYKFVIDVYDAMEMIPWIRSFIGRIEKLDCTNPEVLKVFYEDLEALYDMYLDLKDGGAGDAV